MRQCLHTLFSLLTFLFIALLVAGCNNNKQTHTKRFVTIDGGRKMYIECEGSGQPTIILMSGYRDRGDSSWNTSLPNSTAPTVFTAVGKFTKVCFYDRPGTILAKETSFEKSRSDSVPQPTTAKDSATDLHALLTAAKLKGPYVIVAHSASGLAARLYTSLHLKDVAGMVLVDVTTEDLKEKWTPEEWKVFEYSSKGIPKDLAGYKGLERFNFAESFKQLQAAKKIRALPIPAIVLSSDQVPDAAALIKQGLWPATVTPAMAKQIVAVVSASQKRLAHSFVPAAKHITKTNSGHYIQKEQPQLVINAIHDIVNIVRNKQGKFTTIGNTKLHSEYYPNPTASFKGTIVFENGAGTTIKEWTGNKTFFECVKKLGNVFMYDRNGLGKSPPDFSMSASKPMTAKLINSKLMELLKKNNIKPPYILVAHSFGGMYAGYFARKYPNRVSALLMLDPVPNNYTWSNNFLDKFKADMKIIDTLSSKEAYKRYSYAKSEANKYKTMPAQLYYQLKGFNKSKEQVNRLPTMNKNIPVIIFSAKDMENNTLINGNWYQLQQQWLSKNPNSKIIKVSGGHFVQLDHPELVCAQLKKLVTLGEHSGS